jgi:hypothetical protein
MRSLIDEYLAAYNAMDVPRMLRTLHPRISFRNVVGGRVTDQADGIDAFERLATASLQRFRSRQQLVTAYTQQGPQVSMEVAFSAVLAQDLGEARPAGTTLTLTGRTEIEVDEGLIRKLTDVL